MAERKRIALIFSYNENWIGGTYYILNLAHALNTLPDERKPEITLCASTVQEFDYFANETKYPYLHFFEMNNRLLSLPKRRINKLSMLLCKRYLFKNQQEDNQLKNIDIVFPNPYGSFFDFIDKKGKVYWIPDFQEDYLSEFFSKEEIVSRKQSQIAQALLGEKLVLSSFDAKNDFNRLYPFATCKQYVLPFAVTHPDYDNINIEQLKQKFNIRGTYFYTPNQFWAHKNHKIVIEAIDLIKKEFENILVIFSGKESDYRNANYVDNLKQMIKERNLEKNILFLGFIDRKEQLCLMKNAAAIIQPSLFEGWSTVIEDAKAMNQFVIASDLEVHKEQLKQNVLFFNRTNVEMLAEVIKKVLNKKPEIKNNNYTQNVYLFAEKFLQIIK